MKRREVHTNSGRDKGQIMDNFRCYPIYNGKSFNHFRKVLIQRDLGLKLTPYIAVMRWIRSQQQRGEQLGMNQGLGLMENKSLALLSENSQHNRGRPSCKKLISA